MTNLCAYSHLYFLSPLLEPYSFFPSYLFKSMMRSPLPPSVFGGSGSRSPLYDGFCSCYWLVVTTKKIEIEIKKSSYIKFVFLGKFKY